MKNKANKVKVWIARDEDESLYAYSNPPAKFEEHWELGGFSSNLLLDESRFPSVKWEDDKPTEAYITLAEPQEQPKPEKDIDWEQRHYEIAKDMMYKIYRQKAEVSERGQGIMLKDVADIAVAFADTLISTLKNKNK